LAGIEADKDDLVLWNLHHHALNLNTLRLLPIFKGNPVTNLFDPVHARLGQPFFPRCQPFIGNGTLLVRYRALLAHDLLGDAHYRDGYAVTELGIAGRHNPVQLTQGDPRLLQKRPYRYLLVIDIGPLAAISNEQDAHLIALRGGRAGSEKHQDQHGQETNHPLSAHSA